MKFKFGQFSEFEFDKDDAKIAVPLVLLLVAVAVTPLPKVWLLAGFGVYYAVLFFARLITEPLQQWRKMRGFRCPYCKSLHTVELGLQEYLGDVPHYWFRCNECGKESVSVDNKLMVPHKWKLPSKDTR